MAEVELKEESPSENTKKRNFVHLHLHTSYSTLDGAIKIGNLVERLKQTGMEACAITDHGNMYGAIDFYKSMKQNGLKPIIGSEFYIAPKERTNRESIKGVTPYYHLVLLAENNTGLQNLYKLSTIGFLEGFFKKPRIDKEVLRKYSEGIIGLSACLAGEVPRTFTKEGYEAAKKVALEYEEILGKGNFFLEIQENGIPQQKIINTQLISMSEELGIPLVATCDSHYLNKEDHLSHDILMRIQTGQLRNGQPRKSKPVTISLDNNDNAMDNGIPDGVSNESDDTEDPAVKQVLGNKMEFSSKLYVKSPEEIFEEFEYCPEAVDNTVKIADRCNVDITFGVNHLPQYEVPEGYTLSSYFTELSRKGLEKKLENVDKEKHQEYWDRLEYELKIIIDKGFDGYFLIVWDFINYSRKNNIPVGPGRGSGAGSLVAYSLTITDLDPLKFSLFFERFLNPERVSMPDFDIDFCIKGREKVIKYVTEKYGSDKVSQIVTFGTLKPKAAVRDVCRVFDEPLSKVNLLAKAIPADPSITSFKKAYEADPELYDKFTSILSNGAEIRKHSENLEGLIRQVGMHAAGVIIADKPIVEYAPLAKGPNGETIIQFEKGAAESVGLIKFDFLGLKNLTIIDEAVQRIKNTIDPDFDINKIPLDVEGVYEMLRRGDTSGVFQLESDGMKSLLKKLKPTVFEDIIAANALYRPGPIDSGMLDDFIKRKHGEQEVIYAFDCLEPILKETYGVIVYQEQVMQIAQVLAGYSLGNADNLRRAMGKKKKEEMEANRSKFLYGDKDANIPGVKNKGFDVEKASELYSLIDKFAGYGFNKSHSAAYAYIAYQTAYLKYKYPKEYMSALLSTSVSETKDIVKYIHNCTLMNIPILPPDVNKSFYEFTVEGDGIRFGLGALKSVGEGAVEAFISEREGYRIDENGNKIQEKEYKPYSSIYDLCSRIDYKTSFNKKTLQALIFSGALDTFGKNRSELDAIYLKALEMGQRKSKESDKRAARGYGQGSILDFLSEEEQADIVEEYIEMPEFSEKELLTKEKEILGFFYSSHPLKNVSKFIESFSDSIETIKELNTECEVTLAGIIKSVKPHITKEKKEKMAFIVMEDMQDTIDAVVFPKTYNENYDCIYEDNIIAITGNYKPNYEEPEKSAITVNKIRSIGKAMEEMTGGIQIILKSNNDNMDDIIQIKNLLISNSGKTPVKLVILTDDNMKVTINLPNYMVRPDIDFFEKLLEIESFSDVEILSLNEKFHVNNNRNDSYNIYGENYL